MKIQKSATFYWKKVKKEKMLMILKNHKVRDHSHKSSKYRGAAHSICN